MKKLFVTISLLWAAYLNSMAQCPELQPETLSVLPNNCNQAIVLTPYIQNCRNVCFSSVGATTSTGVSDLSCFGGSNTNDVWLTQPNPYNVVPNYDGSLVFRWIDWPNKSNGIPNPNISIHAEIAGTAIGGIGINIDCTAPAPTQSNNFAQENAICLDNATMIGNQFYGLAGTIPTVSQIVPPSGVTINNIQYYLQVAPADGARGNYCFDVSTYQQGFLCGDTRSIPLTGSGNTVTGSASGCLCSTALDGTMFSNSSNNLPVPCGVESPAAAWYTITLPYSCNQVSIDMASWGGSGNYNIALLSGVSCPGTSSVNPFTNQNIFIPGQTLAPGAVIEASACGQPLNVCRSLAAGTYYIYISGATERPTYNINVTVTDVSPSVGTVTSPQNNQSLCSGSGITLESTGAVLPLSGSCGQNLLWLYSTNPNFNPYNNQGVVLGAGTGTLNFNLPANNTCAPITYFVRGVLSDDGITARSGCRQTTNTITVTIFPAIGQLNILNQPCIITAAPRCPSFLVNGTPGTAQFIGNFALDGQQIDFTVSNGLAACDVTVPSVMQCSGNCDQPTATATVVCNANDTYNYYVDVEFEPGSAASYIIEASDGSALQAITAGTYQMGPFTNGNQVSISVVNTEDANCNLPLGSFVNDCNNVFCPNLTAASVAVAGGATEVCEGTTVNLSATVDQGVLNQDFSIQWFVNGVVIHGANTLNYIHTTSAPDGCIADLQNYSAAITCLLQDASPSVTSQLNAQGSVNVYPIPVIGTDFTPSPFNCNVTPVDLCNGLDIVFSPTTNPTPGAGNTSVNYTVSVPGAPSGCSVSGTYVIQCPGAGCNSSAGVGNTPVDNVVCFGEQFQLPFSNANIATDYSLGYAYTTTNPFNNLGQAVQDAIAANRILGPYTATDVPSFLNDGSVFQSGTYYFIPFVSLNIPNNKVAYTLTGSFSVGSFPGSGSASINVPSTVTFCDGITTYRANLTVQQRNTSFGQPNSIDAVTGPIVSYSGSTTRSLNLTNNNVAFDPRGTTTVIEASGNLFFGADLDYTFNLFHNAVNFPTVCPTCPDAGQPIVLNLLPQIQLTPATAISVCDGESVDLTTLNPTANISGNVSWYNNDPANGGTLLTNITVNINGNTTYWALFQSAADASCTASLPVNIVPTTAPVVNAIASPAPICAGTVVNLLDYNDDVTTNAGTFIWYRGNPQTNANAVRLPDAVASAQQPTPNASQYCMKFTDAQSGCPSYSCVNFTVNALPALATPAVNPVACENQTFDLTSLQAGITSEPGTFVWYEGNPDLGGTQLTPVQATEVLPTTGNTEFCTFFTNSSSGCSNRVCINLNITPLPVLDALPQQGPVCSNEVIDLTALETSISSENGSWAWSTAGNTISTPDSVFAEDGVAFTATFTSFLTGCTESTNVLYDVNAASVLNTVNPNPICVGDTVDLTDFENLITTDAGTFSWYKGNPDDGGILLTAIQASLQFPITQDTFYAVFENTVGCVTITSFNFEVNEKTILTAVAPQVLCAGETANLTLLEPSITAESGTFVWYTGNNTLGTPLTTTEAQSQTITGTGFYTVKFTNANGCSSTLSGINFTQLLPVTGSSGIYSCNLDELIVNLSGTTGGAGGGFNIAPNSPNQNGQSIPNNTSWTVIIADSVGCTQTISGNVNCIECAIGSAQPLNVDTLCCSGILNLEVSGVTVSPNNTVAWGLTPVADGPITSQATADAAAALNRVWQADNATGDYALTNLCPNIPTGNYYLTPFLIENPVSEPLVWDTLNGCRPDGQICPTFSTNLDWKVDTLMGVYPNGDTLDLIRQLTESLLGTPGGLDLDIDQQLLTTLLGGALPCLQLTNLFAGDPNGTWTFIVNNIGTGPLTFNVPDFDIFVSADTCAALNGVDQIVTIPGSSAIIPPDSSYVSISFRIPPLPTSFPSINASCTGFGNPVEIFIAGGTEVCEPNSVKDFSNLSSFTLVPNPAKHNVLVKGVLKNSKQVSIVITDVLGKVMYKEHAYSNTNIVERNINITDFASGVYMIRLESNNEFKTLRLVKE